MKKIISLLAALCVIVSFAVPASAAGFAVSLSPSKNDVSAGDTVTFTVSLSGAGRGTSGYIEVAAGSNFELISGKFLTANTQMADFDKNTSDGTVMYNGESDPNGAFCEFVLKAKTASKTAQNVSVTVDIRNGSSLLGSVKASKDIKIICASHNFGAYIVEDMTASEDLALPETFDWSIIRHGDNHLIIWCEEDITGRENTLVSASVYNSATGEISAADAVVISRTIEGRTFNALNTAFPDGVSWLADSVKTGKVAEYFNGRTTPLNSNGTNWGKPISQQMRPVVPNLAEDFTWRVEKQAGGFIIYWVDLDASTLSAGDLIEGVAKYDTSSGVTSSVTMEVQSDKTMKEYAEPAPMLTALLSLAPAEEAPAEE